MSRRKTVIITVVVIVIFVQWFEYTQSQGITKLVMPGRQTLTLAAGTYSLWYFFRWQSLNIKSEPPFDLNDQSFVTVTSREQAVELFPWLSSVSHGYSDWFHGGWVMQGLRVETRGNYTFESATNCVIAVVPQNRVFDDLSGFPMFLGINDYGLIDCRHIAQNREVLRSKSLNE